MFTKAHPNMVADAFDEVIDEPNFNNFNTSPDPPSPYADLEKKYRKNRYNKNRGKNKAQNVSDPFAVNGNSTYAFSKNVDGNKPQKRKPKKKSFPKATKAKVQRHTSSKRNSTKVSQESIKSSE